MTSNALGKLSHRWTVVLAVFVALTLASATAWGVGGGHGGGGMGGGGMGGGMGGGGHFSGGFGGGHGGFGGGHFGGGNFGRGNFGGRTFGAAPFYGSPHGFHTYSHLGHGGYPYLDHGPAISPFIYNPYSYGYPYGYYDPYDYGYGGGYYAQCDPQVPGYTPQNCD
jgi:hypothetical protein